MRFVRFNAVGVLGFGVQVAVLAMLVGAGVHYLAATALAVEATLLHNFAWHERWTWRDRTEPGRRAKRLLRFHLVNGSVSLAGNLVLMPLLVGVFGLPVVVANLGAALACALANFAGADGVVFLRPSESPAPSEATAPRTSASRSCILR